MITIWSDQDKKDSKDKKKREQSPRGKGKDDKKGQGGCGWFFYFSGIATANLASAKTMCNANSLCHGLGNQNKICV